MAKTKKQNVADKLQEQVQEQMEEQTQETVEAETFEPAVTKEEMEAIAPEGVELSVGEPSIVSHAETGKLFVSAREAYLHAYENFPVFPANWFITENFTWNEAFANEKKEDGVPTLEVFENVIHTATQLQAIRNFVKKPINIHCWVRQVPHNKRVSKAAMSAHINGRAVDFDITGYSTDKTIATASNLRLPIRVEAGTKGDCHIDIGNSYTNNYKWGIFYP